MQPDESSNINNRTLPKGTGELIERILKSTAGLMGDEFMRALVSSLASALALDLVLIGQLADDSDSKIDTLAVIHQGKPLDNFSYFLEATPCFETLSKSSFSIPEASRQKFPHAHILQLAACDGYFGVALKDTRGEDLGILTGLTKQPHKDEKLVMAVLQLVGYRLAAELESQSVINSLQEEVLVKQAQLDSVPALMFMLDTQGNFLRWNKYFSSKFGYSTDEMRANSILNCISKDDHKRVMLEIDKAFEQGNSSFYINGKTRTDEFVPLLSSVQSIFFEGEAALVGVALDMTDQQQVEHNLLRSQGRLARRNSQLSLINELLEKLHQSHNKHKIAGKVVDIFDSISDASIVSFGMLESAGKQLRLLASTGLNEVRRNSWREIPVDESGSPLTIALKSRQLEVFDVSACDQRFSDEFRKFYKEQQVKSGLVMPIVYQDKVLATLTLAYQDKVDFSEEELDFYQTINHSISLALANALQFELMEQLAIQDNLTGLANRNALEQDSQRALEKICHNQDCVGLILLDLDRFKEINDTLGHHIGDKLLKMIGPRIKETLNQPDVTLYRIGGDEFCLLIGQKQCAEEIISVAELVKIAIANEFKVEGLSLEISSSIGVVTTKGGRYSANEFLRCVELAMYHAKNQGGGVVFYTPELDADTKQRYMIMADMASAIRNDELILHYQAKFDLKTHQIVGCEALVRWQHKEFGLLLPGKFIPLVEMTQLVYPLTYWVMKTAMMQIQQWKKQGIQISVAINLSTRNLSDNEFLSQVDSLMEEFAIKSNELEFEVTETALMSDLQRASEQLDEFSRRGISCSLDDYGTGYSSLSYLQKLPLDVLKIDRSFIHQMIEDKADRSIAQSTINLAHSLGMKVVAEGVEKKEVLQELAIQGCDMAQGRYICEPLDAESFARLYWNRLE